MRTPRSIWKRAGLSILAVLLSLAMAEVVLRWLGGADPDTFGPSPLVFENQPEGPRSYTLDADFGYRPVLGGALYSEWGTRYNSHDPVKGRDVRRLLLLGDSVVARGTLQEALEDRLGPAWEVWNAGVEGFNTRQESLLYRRYNRPLEPDVVLLVFHLNDFETTPVCFADADGRIVVHGMRNELGPIPRWWIARSFLFRALAREYIVRTLESQEPELVVRKVEESLRQIAQATASDRAQLVVLIHPLVQRYENWPPGYVARHQVVRSMLSDNDIRFEDLLPALSGALTGGYELEALQQQPGDTWHPSRKLSELFADVIVAKYFVDEPKNVDRAFPVQN